MLGFWFLRLQVGKLVKKTDAARRGDKVKSMPTVTPVRTIKPAPKKGKIDSKVIKQAVKHVLLARKSKNSA